MAMAGSCRRRLLNLRGGQMSHQEEKPKVGRDVEVEVDQSVHQKSRASHNSGELQGPGKRKVTLPKKGKGFEKQNPEEPSAAQAAQHARSSKGFQVVVVSVIHDFAVIKSFVGRVHNLQSAESRARERMVQKNAPGATAHCSTLALGDLKRLQR